MFSAFYLIDQLKIDFYLVVCVAIQSATAG